MNSEETKEEAQHSNLDHSNGDEHTIDPFAIEAIIGARQGSEASFRNLFRNKSISRMAA